MMGMNAEDLRRVHHATPFRPFTLVLADGREFPVPHPDFASISPRGTVVFMWDANGNIGGFLDLDLIAEVRMQTGGRSAARKRKS